MSQLTNLCRSIVNKGVVGETALLIGTLSDPCMRLGQAKQLSQIDDLRSGEVLLQILSGVFRQDCASLARNPEAGANPAGWYR